MIVTIVLDQYGMANNGTTMTAMRYGEGLKKLGHTVRIVTCCKDYKDDYVYTVPMKKIPIVYQICYSQGFIFAKPNKNVLKQAIEGSDVVHFIVPFKLEKKGKQIADSMGVASTAAFHCQPENITYTIKMGKVKWLNNKIYKVFKKFYDKFDYVHCPSEMIANQLRDHGYKSEINVISNGVIDVFKKKHLEKPQELKDKFVILMVGRYSNEKRQDVLIKAISKSKYKDNIKLILAGKGPTRKKLMKLAKKFKVDVDFGFFAPIERLVDVINYSDLYVHPSDAEIEAISCMEAFTCGLVPVISDNELVATNQFAIDKEHCLFKNGDSEDLAKKIDFFYENPQFKKELSEKYVEYAKQYNIDNCILKFEEMLKKAIAKNKERQENKEQISNN